MNGISKLSVSDLEAASRSLIKARETNLGYEVELPVVYPNGQCVAVVINVSGGAYVVHDAGHGALNLTEAGLSLTKQLTERLRRLADAYGCEFVSGRMTKSCTEQQLAIAIALVANASRAVGDQIFEQREGRLRDFRREVETMTMKQLHAARKSARVNDLMRLRRLAPHTERKRRAVMQLAHAGLEPDDDVRTIAPVIAHKLFGKANAADLTAGQRRQVRNFAVDVVLALRRADRLW